MYQHQISQVIVLNHNISEDFSRLPTGIIMLRAIAQKPVTVIFYCEYVYKLQDRCLYRPARLTNIIIYSVPSTSAIPTKQDRNQNEQHSSL